MKNKKTQTKVAVKKAAPKKKDTFKVSLTMGDYEKKVEVKSFEEIGDAILGMAPDVVKADILLSIKKGKKQSEQRFFSARARQILRKNGIQVVVKNLLLRLNAD